MDIIHPPIQQYAESLSSEEDELLHEIQVYTVTHHVQSQMLSGHLQGKVLEMISQMIRPERILEIGTFTGYSALCLAKGLLPNGQLHTIDIRQEDAEKARAYFDRSIHRHQIISHVGHAKEIIPPLNETWDLVFIDADKTGYIDYFNLVFPKLRQGGFILADNIFFHGQVLDAATKGKNAKAMQEFNIFVKENNAIEKVALTIRDGLYLIRKK